MAVVSALEFVWGGWEHESARCEVLSNGRGSCHCCCCVECPITRMADCWPGYALGAAVQSLVNRMSPVHLLPTVSCESACGAQPADTTACPGKFCQTRSVAQVNKPGTPPTCVYKTFLCQVCNTGRLGEQRRGLSIIGSSPLLQFRRLSHLHSKAVSATHPSDCSIYRAQPARRSIAGGPISTVCGGEVAAGGRASES